MDFKLFKRHLNRTSLLVFMIFIIAMIIGVAIVGGTYTKHNEAKDLSRLVLIIIDGLIMSMFVWLLHLVPEFVSFGYVIASKKYITKEKKTTITKFSNPWFLHVLTALFLIAIYFLSITGIMYGWDDDWVAAAKANWWIVLIIFVVNLLIIEFAYNLNLYKFNHDEKIIKEL